MNTDQLTPVVRRWLRHTEATPPDAHRSARQVMARMPYVRQRGRWWPLPTSGRRTSSAPSASDREERFAVTPDTTHRFPTVIGRTQTMFSPVKAIMGGALVFALGGAFLIAQPFGQQAGTVPLGAEVAPVAGVPAPITGSMTWQSTDGSRMAFTEDCAEDGEDCIGHASGLRYRAGYEWSDDRLPTSGEGLTNFEAYDDAGLAIRSTWLLEGADGYWTGPWTGFCDAQDHCWGTVVLTGHGAYDGLYAVLTERPPDEAFGAKSMFEGGIYVGEMPAQPQSLEPTAE